MAAGSEPEVPAHVPRRIREIMSQLVGGRVAPDQIPEERFVSGLGLDSRTVLELLLEVENEFQVTIDDDDLGPQILGSVGRLAAYVARRLPGGAA